MSAPTIGIKLDDETRERLQQLGQRRDRSPHWLMKTAIREYLEREERVERERQEDEERWRRYVKTGAFVANADMMQWLDGLARQADELAERQSADDKTPRRELILPFAARAYVLRHRIEGETIVIVRVWHGREDPRWVDFGWLARLGAQLPDALAQPLHHLFGQPLKLWIQGVVEVLDVVQEAIKLGGVLTLLDAARGALQGCVGVDAVHGRVLSPQTA
jgi:predicted transcriptional regulator